MHHKKIKKPFAVFLDNASIHNGRYIKNWYQENKIECIFNVKYCPHYNGIETLWAYMKQKFR